MANTHDIIAQEVATLRRNVSDLTKLVQQLMGNMVESQQQYQDVLTGIQATQSDVSNLGGQVQKVLQDNAVTGGSTGGGSGAQ